MKDGKKVGITAGAFDLCHAGHMLVFKEAKTVCEHLIVALQDDPSKTESDYRGKKKNTPIMSLEERRIILEVSDILMKSSYIAARKICMTYSSRSSRTSESSAQTGRERSTRDTNCP